MNLSELPTPALVLDVARVRRNAERMSARVKSMGARLRPHIKTHKCVQIARLQTTAESAALTVSTLAEAVWFAARGFTDLTYAVPIEPGKFAAAIELTRECERLALLTDDLETTKQLEAAARAANVRLEMFLKVDCGYHRCGVEPHTKEAYEIARRIQAASHLHFAGILTHAGHSYHSRTPEELQRIARRERDVMVEFAATLRHEDIPVPVVSIGSTPTISTVEHLEGVDEARPGNYIFFDAFQATLGSCRFEDCALTVLSAVVHRDASRRKVVIDAGAVALSKDRGAFEFDETCGYGRVLDVEGRELNLRVASLSQEHGMIEVTDAALFEKLKVGTRLRILANHSCLTAAQHPHYNVLEGGRIVDRWQIQRGW
ncbi:MAG TPA: alanine racemase [Pyrinomonadaceae bacterium]|jgi:D-serine deaminase-like pyridoxal phosphate-dependent protein